MGLHVESIDAYKRIISDNPDINPHSLKTIKEKIKNLKKQMEKNEKKAIEATHAEVTTARKKVRSDHESPSQLMDSAIAFRELGLFKEAMDQYEKLFASDYPAPEFVPELAACLLEFKSPEKVIKQVEEIIGNQNLDIKDIAQVKFQLGSEIEERGHENLALDLFNEALDSDPENKEIKYKIDVIMASRSSGSKFDYLLTNNKVTPDKLQKALLASKKMKKSVEFILINSFKVSKEEVGKSLSDFYDRPFKSFDQSLPVPVELIRNLKKPFLLHDLWVPLSWEKNEVEVLIDDPGDLRKTGMIKGLIKTNKIKFSVGIKEDIEQFITHFFDAKTTAPVENMVDELDMIPDISFEEEEDEEEDENQLDEASSKVVKFVDQLLVSAYRMNASDIHIEPSAISKTTDVRVRLDGVCQEYTKVPNSMARGILSRLKIMANLDIAERRLPQDGKIKFKRRGIPPFELRMATMPTAGGHEDSVLRILAKAGAMKMEQMGMTERDSNIMESIITQPYGLILVVGPTGSGKTTTLHACVGHINRPGVKIWTAEDPIEITQAGLRQVEVKPKIGLDFARVMRSFLRADPDIILIGEMRDYETASIGIEASLTGHLVFSTLHTNNAPDTVTRLLDMGLNPINFSDAFLGVLAQRLVRKVCDNCRKEYHPSKEEFEEIVTEYGKEQFKDLGIKYTSNLTLYGAVGCIDCSDTGYKGRTGIFELLHGTRAIKKLIRKQASSDDIFDVAEKEGLRTMKQDGIRKVFQGVTDINEVRRVCID
ncbi:MAG: type II/IV secretion system protein [Desulfobacterales bacterium]|nr:type II/IV secretion system protein [Desulfobacterales bacterium]